jgi:hypothetical protein
VTIALIARADSPQQLANGRFRATILKDLPRSNVIFVALLFIREETHRRAPMLDV